MNSLNDLLSQKADYMFVEEPKENTPPSTTDDEPSFQELKTAIYQIKDQLDQILRKLNKGQTDKLNKDNPDITIKDRGERIIEGVFNGLMMIGSDGKEYAVPPNYASKSKLVEGDIMKLTFAPNGRFIYKQIGPISRKRIIGILSFDEERQLWNVLHENKKYKVLTASVTFYKGKPNDEAVVLIPQENDCDWCAMENVISK